MLKKMDRNALEAKLDTNNPISRVKYNERELKIGFTSNTLTVVYVIE